MLKQSRRLSDSAVCIKADITSQDETEKGIRAHLNYGHTLGHAVETLTGYSRFLHGEAVAIGMLAAAAVVASSRLSAKPKMSAGLMA